MNHEVGGLSAERAEPGGRMRFVGLSPGRRRLLMYLAMLVADTYAIVLGYLVAGRIVHNGAAIEQAWLMTGAIVPIYWLSAFNVGAYAIATLRSSATSVSRALLALVIAVATVVLIAFVTKSSTGLSRLTFGTGAVLVAVLLVAARLVMRRAARKVCGPTGISTKVLLDNAPDPRIAHATVTDIAAHGLRPSLNDPLSLDLLARHLHDVDRVVVACEPGRRGEWARVLKAANIEGEIVDTQVAELGVLGSRSYGRVGTFIVSTGGLALRHRIVKRVLDLGLAVVALVVLAPVLAIVAIAILIEDGGPVFFTQARIGRGNALFRIIKFRSMRVAASDANGGRSTSRDDDRVTRVGAVIRAMSIDELPQLFNILLGTMTFVGPRPHALESTAQGRLFWHIDPRYFTRHVCKPGLTGLAQVKGLRGATHLEADLVGRLQADLDYVARWTLLGDIAILARTVGVVLHKNAY